MLVLELFEREGAGEHDHFKWELVGAEMVVEEMHGEQEHHRQESFFSVEDRRHIEHPAWQESTKHVRQPHDQTTHTDDGDPPERSPIVKFFPIGPAVKFWPWAFAKEPLEHGQHVFAVLQVWNHRVGAKELEVFPVTGNAPDQIEQVPEEHTGKDHRIHPVDGSRDVGATQGGHEPVGPWRIRVKQRYASEREDHQAQGKGQVSRAPDRAKAAHVFALVFGRHGLGLHAWLLAHFFALFEFAVEPQQGVQPEEAKRAHQQLHHDLPGHPDLRVAVEITRMAVRLEGGKACGGIGQVFFAVVALPARFHAVVDVCLGFWISGLQDSMAAMAVVAFGGVGVAQCADLAVVGGLVGFQVFLMAGAALLGDCQLEGVARRVGNSMGTMAIATDRCFGVFLVEQFFSVNRSSKGLELVFVARFGAGIGNAQAPLVVRGRAFGWHIKAVGVVAVVARCVGAGLVVGVGAGVE